MRMWRRFLHCSPSTFEFEEMPYKIHLLVSLIIAIEVENLQLLICYQNMYVMFCIILVFIAPEVMVENCHNGLF